jgi:hypothetical protein
VDDAFFANVFVVFRRIAGWQRAFIQPLRR